MSDADETRSGPAPVPPRVPEAGGCARAGARWLSRWQAAGQPRRRTSPTSPGRATSLPELHPSYVEKHGKSPNVAIFAEEEEAFQKLRGGFKADLAHPCTYAVPRWREAGLFAPIDVEPPRLVAGPVRATEGYRGHRGRWPALVRAGGVGAQRASSIGPISSRSGRTGNPGRSLFDETLKGKIAMFDGVEQAVFAAAMVAGFEDPFSLSDEQLR